MAAKDWFKVQEWYTDNTLTTKYVEGTLAEDTKLYANYAFNIGLGDVNADGYVTANDITLYRQWIVGGYEMTVVEKGDEWATVNAEGFSTENTYFVKRVADSNALNAETTTLGDQVLDIRDVSTMRMALVGGYGFSPQSRSSPHYPSYKAAPSRTHRTYLRVMPAAETHCQAGPQPSAVPMESG